MTRPIYTVFHRGRTFSPIGKKFLQFLKERKRSSDHDYGLIRAKIIEERTIPENLLKEMVDLETNIVLII